MGTIKRVPFALNRYQNQFEIEKSDHNSITTKTTFENYVNHKIKFKTETDLINQMGITISNKRVNAIFTNETTFYSIRKFISDAFPKSIFIFTTLKVANMNDLNLQLNIVSEIHDRAHRNAKNNYTEAQRIYFWPTMKKDFFKWSKACEICKTEKYERIPVKQPIGATPIPTAVGESISMDLFYIDNKFYEKMKEAKSSDKPKMSDETTSKQNISKNLNKNKQILKK